MRTTVALALVLLSGCGNNENFTYGGTVLWEMFPFDGTRTWEYINDDTELSWTMVGTMTSSEPENENDFSVYTVEYTKHCVGADDTCVEGELVRSIRWSSDAVSGVHIHTWAEGESTLQLDPPIRLAASEGEIKDTQLTHSAGFNWTTTFEAFEECPVRMTVDWPNCGRFHIDDGDGDPLTGLGLVGSYWAVRGAGITGLELSGDLPRWQLLKNDCLPEEDCNGFW